MNKHLSKFLLLFLICFCGQTSKAVWVHTKDLREKLQSAGFSITQPFCPAYYLSSSSPSEQSPWAPQHMDFTTAAKLIAFLETADLDRGEISQDQSRQNKRAFVLGYLAPVIKRIFEFFINIENVDPVVGSEAACSFEGFQFDAAFFSRMGEVFNNFIVNIEGSMQHESDSAAFDKYSYKVYESAFCIAIAEGLFKKKIEEAAFSQIMWFLNSSFEPYKGGLLDILISYQAEFTPYGGFPHPSIVISSGLYRKMMENPGGVFLCRNISRQTTLGEFKTLIKRSSLEQSFLETLKFHLEDRFYLPWEISFINSLGDRLERISRALPRWTAFDQICL